MRKNIIRILLSIVTWWKGPTLSTRIAIFYRGKYEGCDNQGNKYYSLGNKRWMVNPYNTSSDMQPDHEWYAWLHYMTENTPTNNEIKIVKRKEYEVSLCDPYHTWAPK